MGLLPSFVCHDAFLNKCCLYLGIPTSFCVHSLHFRKFWRKDKHLAEPKLSDLEILCGRLDPSLAFRVQETWIDPNQITTLDHLGSGVFH